MTKFGTVTQVAGSVFQRGHMPTIPSGGLQRSHFWDPTYAQTV